MSRKPAKDPFAYFNSGKDADIPNVDSESESDEENVIVSDTDTTKNPVSYISKSGDSSAENKLPSAEKALEETVKPKFLESHKTKGHIDWEKHVKNDTLQEEEVSITNTHAIPPPKTYTPETEPIKPTLGNNTASNIQAMQAPFLKRSAEGIAGLLDNLLGWVFKFGRIIEAYQYHVYQSFIL